MYDEREEELTPEIMRDLERFLLLQIMDDAWREHLHDMDYLREGIHLRALRPDRADRRLQERGVRALQPVHHRDLDAVRAAHLHVQVQVEEPDPAAAVADRWLAAKPARVTYESGGSQGLSALAAAAAGIDPIAAAAAASAPGPVEEAPALNREQRRQLEREKKKQNKRNAGS